MDTEQGVREDLIFEVLTFLMLIEHLSHLRSDLI